MGSPEFDLVREQEREDALEARYEMLRPDMDVLAEEMADKCLLDPDWWAEEILGDNGTTGALPRAMSDCMKNLDSARAGDEISRKAILSALCLLQRAAYTEALDESFPIAEKEVLRA